MTPRLRLKNNEEEARERSRAFWHGKSLGRPGLIVHAKDKSFKPIEWKGAALSKKEADFNPEWHEWSCYNGLFSNKYLAEAIPSVTVNFGSHLAMLAILAGADYEYDDSAWIVPKDNVLEIDVPKFDPNCELIKKLEDCFEKIIDVVEDKAAICPPIMLDAITTLSMMHTSEELCVSLVEESEKVKRLTQDMTTLNMDWFEHFYRFLGQRGYTDNTSWYSLLSEGRMDAMQCDFSVMLSADMYEEFVLPDLKRMSAYFENGIYHHDGVEQFRFIEKIASAPKMKVIQWNPVNWQNIPPEEHLHYYKQIKELGLSLYIFTKSVDDAVYLTKKLGPDGLMLTLPMFECEEDANAAISRIQAACKK